MNCHLSFVLVGLLASWVFAQETTTSPAIIEATDKAALDANAGKQVVVQGKVESAEWSNTGKVMNIRFANAPDFMAAAFERNRKKLDEAFNGDLAKTLTGAQVKLTGKLQKYGGHIPELKDAQQLVITSVNQVTIVAPATQPASE